MILVCRRKRYVELLTIYKAIYFSINLPKLSAMCVG